MIMSIRSGNKCIVIKMKVGYLGSVSLLNIKEPNDIVQNDDTQNFVLLFLLLTRVINFSTSLFQLPIHEIFHDIEFG